MDSRSYKVVQKKESYIVSISRLKEKLTVECVEINNNTSKKYISVYSIDHDWPFKNIFKTVLEAKNELINAIEKNLINIIKKMNILELIFIIQSNPLIQILNIELKLKKNTQIKEENDSKKKIEAILSDAKKKDFIEIRFIKKLYEIDKKDLFLKDYILILNRCEESRQNGFKEAKHNPLAVLGKNASFISKIILDEIYSIEKQELLFNMIKGINEFKCNAREEKQFLNKITHVFYHSRRLLNAVIAPKIIDIFIDNREDIKEKSYVILNYKRIYEVKPNDNSSETLKILGERCNFIIGTKSYTCEFFKKNKGVFFGSLIEIRESNNILQRYYFKGHNRYPVLNSNNSMDSNNYSPNLINSIEGKDSIEKTLSGIDLREIFVYKVLEKIGYGPKSHIIVNPYINFGLYIMTEDLNSNDNIFKELSTIKNELGEYFEPFFSEESNENVKILIKEGLIQLNIIACIFKLIDLKEDNLGFLGTSEIWKILMADEKNDKNLNLYPYIIDFLNDEKLIEFGKNEKKDIILYLIEGKMFKHHRVENEFRDLISISTKSYKDIFEAIDKKDIKKIIKLRSYYTKIMKLLRQLKDKLFKQTKDAWNKWEKIFIPNYDKIFKEIHNYLIDITKNLLQRENENDESLYKKSNDDLNDYINYIEENISEIEKLFSQVSKDTKIKEINEIKLGIDTRSNFEVEIEKRCKIFFELIKQWKEYCWYVLMVYDFFEKLMIK